LAGSAEVEEFGDGQEDFEFADVHSIIRFGAKTKIAGFARHGGLFRF
jgi:hypothetical protein